jgi:hypothetical protein
VRTPYPRVSQPLAQVAARRERAVYTYKLARNFAVAALPFFVLTLFVAPPEIILTLASLVFAFLAWRHGTMKTLLELKGLRWRDAPLSRRFVGFPEWYQSAPDEYDYGHENSLTVPPRPGVR